MENSVWYSGIEQDLAYFYRKQAPKFYRKGQASESMNYFWGKSDVNFRRIHSGFPQLICEKMVDLLIGNGFEIKVEGKKENELQEELDALLDDNDFKQLLSKSIETESWSGGVAWKLSWNPELTDYPIIEVWQPENYTRTMMNGRVIEDIFYYYYDKNNTKFRLSEIYGVDKKGAYIDYKLERLTSGVQGEVSAQPEWKVVSLSELEQTKDLKRYEFEGYFKRLSAYKPNKTPNSEFRQSYWGESDYAGSYGAFDAVDEIISTWIQEFRDGKLHRYFPEEFMKKNGQGDYVYPDEFLKEHILFEDTPSENVEKQKISYMQGDLRVEKHRESYKIWVTQIINNAGLSPLTVGVTGLESIDASAESQQEREKVSIRTRNKKIELWTEFLEQYLKIALEFRMMMKGMQQNEEQSYDVGDVPEFDIITTFNDYIIKSKNDRTLEVREGLGSAWDIASAVNYVHDDMTERERMAISARVKLENNYNSITQAELSALQAENEIHNEKMKDEGVEIVETEPEVETDAETT